MSNTTDMLTVNAARTVAAGVSELADAGGPWSAPAEIFTCFAFVLLLCILAYAIGQARTLFRLVKLLRQPGRKMPLKVAWSCRLHLAIFPGIMLFFMASIVCVRQSFRHDSDHGLLMLLAFTPAGAIFALGSWVMTAVWLIRIIGRPKALYRSAISLLPIIVMALMCLTYSAAIAWAVGRSVPLSSGFSSGPLVELILSALASLLIFLVPTAPLAGLVLLIIHVVRMLPPGGRATIADFDNEGEIP
jgi:hypothetical protein